MNTWQSLIWDLRKKRDLTLAQIGTEIGLSTGAVSDIAQGRSAAPGGDAAVRLLDLHRRHFPEDTGVAA